MALLSSYRVLKNNGILTILEFGKPNKGFDLLYEIYQNTIMNAFADNILKYQNAFEYLKNTSSEFPYGKDLSAYIETLGLKTLKIRKMTLGIAYLYIFKKK